MAPTISRRVMLLLVMTTACSVQSHRHASLRFDVAAGQPQYPVEVDPTLIVVLSNRSDDRVTACMLDTFDETLHVRWRADDAKGEWVDVDLSGEVIAFADHAAIELAGHEKTVMRLRIPYSSVGTWCFEVAYTCDRAADGEVVEPWTLEPVTVRLEILAPDAREQEALQARAAIHARLRSSYEGPYADTFLSELAPKYSGIPSFAPDHYNAAVALARRGEVLRARTELETIVRDYPPFDQRADALALLAQLDFEQGSIDSGRKALATLREVEPDRDVRELLALERRAAGR